MKILIDMNLSPKWVGVFVSAGHEALHWHSVGSAKAPDEEILNWAFENGYIVFTHDLDFSATLAATRAKGPSVIQVRTKNVKYQALKDTILQSLREFEPVLAEEAVLTIDETRSRAHILPFG